MGTGVSPNESGAAEAYGLQACNSTTCFYPLMGPVTAPTNYTWAIAPPTGSSTPGPFYFGNGSGYTWQQFQTFTSSGGTWTNTTPNLFVPSTTRGTNGIPIAALPWGTPGTYDTSFNDFDNEIYVLTGAAGNFGHHLKIYASSVNDWVSAEADGSSVFLQGIIANSDAALFGWDTQGTMWSNEYTGGPGTYQVDFFDAFYQEWFNKYTSVAANGAPLSSGSFFSTTTSSNCTPSGKPNGPCIDVFEPGGSFPTSGSWANYDGAGAAQIVRDSVTGNLFALGNTSGYPWQGAAGGWEQLTSKQCNSNSTLVFVLLAAKNGVLFGMNQQGTVWYLGPGASCWAQVGTRSDWATSISTDNSYNGGNIGVWATDQSGNMWTAQ
jgi:hypothetical protein